MGDPFLSEGEKVIAVGAHSERRGDAWPARGLLGGKDRAGRFVCGSEISQRRSPQPLAVERLVVVRARHDWTRPEPDPCQKSPTTSPRWRVLRAWSNDGGVLSLTKRTLPSANAKLAPPGWALPKAQTRSTSSNLSPPAGIR